MRHLQSHARSYVGLAAAGTAPGASELVEADPLAFDAQLSEAELSVTLGSVSVAKKR